MFQGIGIDLGTTYSSVAIWHNGEVEIIANDQGNRTTPSFVAFTESERLLGDAAKNQVAINPTNTIFDTKRLIGRRFEDKEIREDRKFWPFNIISVCGKIMIEVRYGDKVEVFTPEEISAMILVKMRQTAEAYLGMSVRNAVITVPAYFDDTQREATKLAGVFAGLEVMKIMDEPTAAAFAYGFHKNLKERRNVFIFDLGGGTFDVSILSVNKGSQFEVLATAGDSHLGGQDFDNRLVKHIIEEFKRKNKRDVSVNSRALHRLRLAVERAKRCLSSSTEAAIQLDALCDGIDVNFTVTRAKFEAICFDLFQKTSAAVQKALEIAKLEKSDIHDVVLVGGSTKMPKIRQILEACFSDKVEKDSVNPEEAVVRGAAIQAALLCNKADSKINGFFLLEIAPLSLGIETAGGIMTRVIQRGAKVPCRVTQTFTTFSDNQRAITVQIFQGERSLTKDNYHLGSFTLSGIPLLPCGVPQIEVVFDLGVNGVLHVEGKEVTTQISHSVQMESKCGGMMQKEIRRLVVDADKYKEEDESHCKKVEAYNKLHKFICQVKQAIKQYEDELNEVDMVKLHMDCEKCLVWLREHPKASVEDYEDQYCYLLASCEECSKNY